LNRVFDAAEKSASSPEKWQPLNQEYIFNFARISRQ